MATNSWLEKALKIKPYYQKASQILDDKEALVVKGIYLTWEQLVELGSVKADAGYKFTYNGDLYKCVNANPTFQADWVPGISTGALYIRIDESDAGDSPSNPITAARGMEYVYGNYYLDPEDNKVYLCSRTGATNGETIVLHHLPHELIGHYFAEVSE